MEKCMKEKGITIIALVVTIIIMLLLVGISMGFIAGDNGLISRTLESIKIGKIEEYRDIIKLDRAGTEVQSGIRNMTNKEYMDSYENELKKDAEDGNLNGSSVRRKDEGTVRVVTPEGFVFDVTREGVEYVGKQGEDEGKLPPKVDSANTKVVFTPSEWTNKSVMVSIETEINEEGQTIQYSYDAKEWKTYREPFEEKDNGTIIYARILNSLDMTDGLTSGTVQNIDRLPPIESTFTETHTSEKIIVIASGKDHAPDKTNGESKIAEYYFSKDGGQNWTPSITGKGQKEPKYTFEGLDGNKVYKIQVRVKDAAGNYLDSEAKEITTVPVGTGTITITPSTANWTNQDVEMTITSSIGGYTIEYSKYTADNWETYNEKSKPKMERNGIIYARLVSGANIGTATSTTLEKIDKTAPTVNDALKVTASTTSSVSLSTAVTDSASGLGKIIWYYTVDTTTKNIPDTYQAAGATAGATTKQTKTKQLTGLSAGKTYKTYAEVYDVAGNKTRTPTGTTTVDKATVGMTEKEIGTITVTPSTTNWTNQDVTFTITTTADTSIFKLQYSTTGNSGWADYVESNKPKLTANGTMYARLVEKAQTGNVSSNASSTVSKIDKTAPTVNTALTATASTTSSVSLSTGVTDSASGLGKIIWYYTVDSTTKNVTDTYQAAGATAGATTQQTKTKTITGLTAGKTYKTYAEVYDVAGNKTRTPTGTTTVDRATTAMSAVGTITVTPSTTNWTNQDVTFTITTTADTNIFKLQYSTTGNSGWADYNANAKPSLSANGTMYARLIEIAQTGNVSGNASSTVSKIDKTAPTVNTPLTATASTTSSVSLSTAATDSASGLGKIIWYYTVDSTTKNATDTYQAAGATAGATTQQTKTKTITGLSAGKTYKTYAEVYDVAGNKTRTPTGTTTVDKATTGMPATSTITVTPSTTNWTNGDVTFTITTTADTNTFKLQCSTNASSGWADYNASAKPKLTANGTMYARLVEKAQTGNVSGNASSTISKIDKTAPTVNTALSATGSTTSSVSLSTAATDTASGLGKIIWYYTLDSTTKNVTDTYQAAGATAGATTQQTKTKTITGLTAGKTYKTYAEVYDVAGNKTRTPTGTTTVDKATTGMPATGTITVTPSTNNWTNGDVTFTITTTADTNTFKLQCSTNASSGWADYNASAKPKLTANGTMYARLVEKAQTGNVSGNASSTISKIDKTAPTVNTALSATGSTTSSVSLSTAATDTASGLGKIIWYYTLDSTTKNVTDTYQAAGATAGATTQQTKTKTITGLTAGKTYKMYAEVYDVAGNKTRTPTGTTTVDKATTAMSAVGTITVTPSTTNWTNGDVTFTITTTADANLFKLQCSTNASSGWADYNASAKPKLTANGTMYARLVEKAQTGNVSGNASSTISKIDKTAPTVNTALSATGSTTSSVSLSTAATDTASGLGKIIWYYTVDSTTKNVTDTYQAAGATAGATTQQTKTKTISGLTNGKTYKMYAEVYDVAGNKTRTPAGTTTVDRATTAMSAVGTITVTPSTTNWTNGNVTFTITTTADTSKYKLQYSTTGTGNWTDYNANAKPSLSANGTMYARLIEIAQTGNVSGNTSSTISKIDKLPPNVPTFTETHDSSSVTITVTATDQGKTTQYAESGIGLYYFSTNNGSSYTPAAGQSGKSLKINLNPGTYTLKVKVKDNAGNEKESTQITSITIEDERPKVGDVVNYTPNTTASSYNLPSNLSGYKEAQTVTKQTYTWKVLNIKDNSIDIMATPKSGSFYLCSAPGYNNGVYLLNDICKTLYSNSSLGVTARSINLDDIIPHFSETGKKLYASSSTLGTTQTYSGSTLYYPKLAAYENVLGINGAPVKTNGIGPSDDGRGLAITIPLLESNYSEPTNSRLEATSLTVKNTFFGMASVDNYEEDFWNVAFGYNIDYWIATRYTSHNTSGEPSAGFGLFIGRGKTLFNIGVKSDGGIARR